MPTDNLRDSLNIVSYLWGHYAQFEDSYTMEDLSDEAADEAPASYEDELRGREKENAIECEYEIIEEGETHELLHD